MNLFSIIKQRLTILEVVSEYATLKKAGLYWKGCCPFHHERTPSFTVSPHKEIFYCFGCHAGGDVISFVAKIEHCSPIEAAKHLAERHNIPLPENVTWEKGTDSQEAKNAYYAACTLFARWCQEQLKASRIARVPHIARHFQAKHPGFFDRFLLRIDQIAFNLCSAREYARTKLHRCPYYF